MLAALAFVFLALGSFVQVADISSSVLAGACVFAVELKYKTLRALAVYLVTAVLAAVLLPHGWAVIIFVCFSGVYPCVKRLIEAKLPRTLSFAVKALVFVLLFSAFMALARWLMGFGIKGLLLNAAAFVGLGIAFFAADAALSLLMRSGFISAILTNNKR